MRINSNKLQLKGRYGLIKKTLLIQSYKILVYRNQFSVKAFEPSSVTHQTQTESEESLCLNLRRLGKVLVCISPVHEGTNDTKLRRLYKL